ncbi:NADP-dependent oxidoreductase [Fibrella sp. WM1]|uniref:NADP-dependent oxidoreductase n=1 Tax=Fibrella musci TaxID=3242485 RepID=UPI0035224D2C
MKAITISERGSLDNIQVQDLDVPTPNAGQVLVRVHACGINPVDWKGVMNGIFQMPYIIGTDIAGVVEQVGADVTTFAVGDEVIGSLEWATQGAFADYIVTEPKHLALKPTNLSFAEAAAIPLAGLTAWQGLFDKLMIQPGQKVLVQAAAGGVGYFAVQLAKWKGARVVAVASEKNEAFVREAGADEVIDYRNGYDSLPADFDAVFDSMGTSAQTIPLLKPGGRYVTITAKPAEGLAEQHGVTAQHFLFHADADQMTQLVGLIEQGTLKVVLDRQFALTDAKEALAYQKLGHSKGKNVLLTQ